MIELDHNKKYLLTTKDNPKSPVTEFDEWLSWDNMLGYNTINRLAAAMGNEYDNDTLTQEEKDEIERKAQQTLIQTGAISNSRGVTEYILVPVTDK